MNPSFSQRERRIRVSIQTNITISLSTPARRILITVQNERSKENVRSKLLGLNCALPRRLIAAVRAAQGD
jgi:hypothetical protein